MFCPNCGQDCGTAKFCARCGTQLQKAVAQESPKAAWAVGTPCPYCGGVGLNDNCCAFCGVQLIPNDADDHKTKKERKFVPFNYICGYFIFIGVPFFADSTVAQATAMVEAPSIEELFRVSKYKTGSFA